MNNGQIAGHTLVYLHTLANHYIKPGSHFPAIYFTILLFILYFTTLFTLYFTILFILYLTILFILYFTILFKLYFTIYCYIYGNNEINLYGITLFSLQMELANLKDQYNDDVTQLRYVHPG